MGNKEGREKAWAVCAVRCGQTSKLGREGTRETGALI